MTMQKFAYYNYNLKAEHPTMAAWLDEIPKYKLTTAFSLG